MHGRTRRGRAFRVARPRRVVAAAVHNARKPTCRRGFGDISAGEALMSRRRVEGGGFRALSTIARPVRGGPPAVWGGNGGGGTRLGDSGPARDSAPTAPPSAAPHLNLEHGAIFTCQKQSSSTPSEPRSAAPA